MTICATKGSESVRRLKAAQIEAARVWNCCMELHKQARVGHTHWPGQRELEQATKGRRFALNAQAVQQIVHTFLPMGKGNPSLVLPLTLPETAGACTLVWNRGFELHVCVEIAQAETAPGTVQATVDLGEIHLAAVTTATGKALIVTGRGIRSLKRQRSKQLGQLAKKLSRCQKHSRRFKKLQRAKNKVCRRAERRVSDLRHEEETGSAAGAVFGAIATSLARSICVHLRLIHIRSFLVPSRISVLAHSGPGKGVVGQTRPNVVQVSQRLNHTFQTWFPWEQAAPLMMPGSPSPRRGQECHYLPDTFMGIPF